MATSTSAPHQAFVDHLVARMHSDVGFLSSQGLLTAQDAEAIKAKLPSGLHPIGSGRVERLDGALDLNTHPSERGQAGRGAGSIDRATCRALWDYQASQPDDLPFTKGQIILLESELNQDWWQGSIDGRKGIFPSNHVERLPFNPISTTPSNPSGPPPPPAGQFAPSPSPSPSPAPYHNNQAQPQGQYAYQQPQPYAASYAPSASNSYQPGPPHYAPSNNSYLDDKQHYTPPPPPQQIYQPPPPPTAAAAPTQVVGTTAPQPPPVPKKRFGKVGSQLGSAFVGGLGFGTGTAVASNAINAIF